MLTVHVMPGIEDNQPFLDPAILGSRATVVKYFYKDKCPENANSFNFIY